MMNQAIQRRDFLRKSALGIAGLAAAPMFLGNARAAQPLFKISLAQWSMHKAIRSRDVDPIDFAKIARTEFDIGAIEYVNQLFMEKIKEPKWMADLGRRADDHGVKNVLIMCDSLGNLGDPDNKKRTAAVDAHRPWAEAAKKLGCHSIRVNAASSGSYQEQMKLAADGLRRLSEDCVDLGLNVIVENHGGLSSNGRWLSGTLKKVNLRNCGSLPDFGNFRIKEGEWYDRYQGVKELMPYAYSVSAKSHTFDGIGNETQTDFYRMMKIVLDAGYRGYVGIEYEGSELGEFEGIRATKKLLEKVRDVLA